MEFYCKSCLANSWFNLYIITNLKFSFSFTCSFIMVFYQVSSHLWPHPLLAFVSFQLPIHLDCHLLLTSSYHTSHSCTHNEL